MTPFAAVLLAGGRSRRMGRDKALLSLADGRLLWQRQLDVLRELQPAELFISGPAREGFPPDVSLLADAAPSRGPLSGIAVALAVMRSPLLVVLAVDLPRMTAAFLHTMLAASRENCGTVPWRGESGFYEPLAAVYPARGAGLAAAFLAGQDWSLQSFVRAAVSVNQLGAWPLHRRSDIRLFANWNTLAGGE